VYLQDDGPKIGRGKIQLLKAVRDHGSIAAAARSMGMAYRHAWLLLDELNRSFLEPVITSKTGGQSGGGAVLTDWGIALVDRFEEMERIAMASVAEHLEALDAQVATPDARHPRSTGKPRRPS
jgi:molybdate transport system regulatory protein